MSVPVQAKCLTGRYGRPRLIQICIFHTADSLSCAVFGTIRVFLAVLVKELKLPWDTAHPNFYRESCVVSALVSLGGSMGLCPPEIL